MTNRCEPIRIQIAFYLDEELREADREVLESHLSECPGCRALLERERRFLEGVRASRPLYEASPELRRRVASVLEEAEPALAAPSDLRRRVHRSLGNRLSARPRGRLRVVMAVAAIVLLLGVWGVARRNRRIEVPGPSEFAAMAVDVHLRYLRNQLPLEIASESPERISAWFAGKVSFGFKLPSYQESSGQEKLYQLQGARLVGFKNDYAAYVAYRMRQRPITLVVTANAVAMPAGGEQIVSKGLRFHYDAINGYKVITWSDRGLTYALVSDLEERGQQSCLVCHAGTKDRDFLEDLRK
ncbi:MAG: zf-HC2 domain-containing protein [Blastocatellia bacterium]|nr:zf-HC2 domain-containing protein [Blastocatellia bacterium]